MGTILRPYPNYKDTGCQWLGAVPAHWKIMPNRALFHEVKDVNHPDEPLLSVTITRGVITQETLLAESSKKDSSNADKSKYKLVQPGDIVYNKMRAWQGAIGVSKYRGIVSPAYIVVRPRQDVDPQYYHYLLRTPAFVREAERWSYGITSDMWSLRYEDFKQICCISPPINEQHHIARFLDYYIQRVNRLIGAKQRRIDLLNEKKQAITQRAVTRGLNPGVRMKPSGVEWLEAVPEHWTVLPLKRLARMKSGESITSLHFIDRGRYPVYGGNGVRGYTDAYTHDGNFVLIGRQGALCGNIHYASGKFWATEHAVVVTLREQHDLTWFGELLRAMNLKQYSQSAAQPGLSVERIQNIRAPIPPPDEQRAISQYLREATQDIDKLLYATNKEVELIREYRTRLIADVVTGQLDVRHVSLPEIEVADQSNLATRAGNEFVRDEDTFAYAHD